MWEQPTNCSADQVWVKSSIWYPIITPESPALMPITDSELTVSSDGRKAGREDPSPLCREGKGIRWLFAKLLKLYAQPYRWDCWGTADWVAQGPPTQGNGGSSHTVHTWFGLMTITRLHICLPWVSSKGCNGTNPNGCAPEENMASSMAPESRK